MANQSPISLLSSQYDPKSPYDKYQSQKARGVAVTRACDMQEPLTRKAITKAVIYPHDAFPVTYPYFARPCPKVPRHGFIESRLISDEADLKKLLKEIKHSDEPEAEIICMPFIEPLWSAVLTVGGVTFGAGHDGATGGKNCATVPAPAKSEQTLRNAFTLPSFKECGITDSPFIELVADQHSPETIDVVQVRNGPKLDLSHDRVIPKKTVVKQVIEFSESAYSMLDWEKKMAQVKGKDGVVVWHFMGSLSAHCAVQAVVNKIPVICSHNATSKPKVGQTLEPTGGLPKLTAAHYKMLAGMIGWAVQKEDPSTNRKEGIRLALSALHAQHFWGGERHLLALRAVAVTYFVRFASAAILGELRHWGCHGPGRHHHFRLTTGPYRFCKSAGRDTVYTYAFNRKLYVMARRLSTAVLDFGCPGWPNGGYGGEAWKKCAETTVNLCTAIGHFLQTPDEQRWGDVVSKWNIVVNTVHNNGPLLNKFCSQGVMDTIAHTPIKGLMSHLVAKIAIDPARVQVHGCPRAFAKRLLEVQIPPKAAAVLKAKDEHNKLHVGEEKTSVTGSFASHIKTKGVGKVQGAGFVAAKKHVTVKQVLDKLAGEFKAAETKVHGSVKPTDPVGLENEQMCKTMTAIEKGYGKKKVGSPPIPKTHVAFGYVYEDDNTNAN